MEVVSAAIKPDEFFSSIEGQLRNTNDVLVETSYLDCIIRAAGTVVGGASTASLDPIPPGGSVSYSVGLDFLPAGADAAECQAIA